MLVATKTNSNSCHFSNRSCMFVEELGRDIFFGFAVMDDLKKTDAGRRIYKLRMYDKTANKLLAKKLETNRKHWWLECKNCGGFIDLRSSQDAHYISHINGG